MVKVVPWIQILIRIIEERKRFPFPGKMPPGIHHALSARWRHIAHP